MARKHVDPLKAKQKKQKILLAVLGVVFLGLVAFQAPKVMKQLNPPASPQRSAETTPLPAGAAPPTLAAPTLRGAAQGPSDTTAASGSLVSASPTTVQDGQLASFSRFASKDPFAQQLSEKDSSTGSTGSGSSTGGGSGSGAGDPGIPDVPGSAPAPGTAVISVNGALYTVTVGTDFPEASSTDPTIVPLFHLVSATAHTVKISIVGGAYSSGARTVTLKEKKAVTLMNTADGTRYTLILMSPGTDVPTDGSATTKTPTTVTLPPATP
jgi:hypothetical protein